MTDGGGGCTTGASSLSFFGSDSTTASPPGGLGDDDDGSAYLLGDSERTTTTAAGSAVTCATGATGGGVCSFCGGWSESFLYWDALRNLIFTLRNSLVSTSTTSSSGFGSFDFLLYKHISEKILDFHFSNFGYNRIVSGQRNLYHIYSSQIENNNCFQMSYL